jgi:hypothetical protein
MTEHNFYVREFIQGDLGAQKTYVIGASPYRQHISYSGFMSYKHKRNHVVEGKHFFINKFADDLAMEEETSKRLLELSGNTYRPPKIELIECKDIYDFYEKIGYNRHTKRFERYYPQYSSGMGFADIAL